ncbi:hypothetical protein HK098_008372 [Nowakowskiella sp. JEL0407]|nr:hypothetical protein HK098_008372 [Nowakowskiella sp. JEL0407]
MQISSGENSTVTLFITSESASSERRFDKSISIAKFKERLEPITGISSAHMSLSLYSQKDELITKLADADKMLGFYSVQDFMRVDVVDTNPYRKKNEFTDLSQVPKFELSENDYDQRRDTVRDYLRRNKLGKFSDGSDTDSMRSGSAEHVEQVPDIPVGSRCMVQSEDGISKRGIVKYFGQPGFKEGYWVGIEYDEPLGKHDGTVAGTQYFVCRPKHGAFVRPNRVTVGDFPEEDLFDEDEEL